MLSDNGDIYEGEFKAWLRHGKGVQKWATGEEYHGIWESDCQVHGVYVDREGQWWKGNFSTGDVTLMDSNSRVSGIEDVMNTMATSEGSKSARRPAKASFNSKKGSRNGSNSARYQRFSVHGMLQKKKVTRNQASNDLKESSSSPSETKAQGQTIKITLSSPSKSSARPSTRSLLNDCIVTGSGSRGSYLSAGSTGSQSFCAQTLYPYLLRLSVVAEVLIDRCCDWSTRYPWSWIV